jgi:transcription termination factor NusB
MESGDYSIWLDGTEEPVAIVAAFDLPEDFGDEERVLWIEAVLDEETLSQTVVRLHDRYSV